MKTPFGRVWSIIRGDKHMVGAYPPPPDPAGPETAESDAPASAPPKEP